MIEFAPEVNKKFILKHVSQEEIFEHYLNMRVEFGEYFRSPLRDDRNPTCSIKKFSTGVVHMKDWSGHFSGDCFDLVQHLYGCNFAQACAIIANDFKLVKNNNKIARRKPLERTITHSEKTLLTFRWRNWSEEDKKYWREFGITEPLLSFFNVAPVQELWINNKRYYVYHKDDPAYAYYFGDDQWKVYFPNRQNARFICNTAALQGLRQLPEKGEVCVITKSLKDVMVLYNFGIRAVAPQSETSIITQEQWDELKDRFDHFYSLYDFDLTGVRSANKMKKSYGIEPRFLTDGRFDTKDYGAKDVSDLFKNKGAGAVTNWTSTLVKR